MTSSAAAFNVPRRSWTVSGPERRHAVGLGVFMVVVVAHWAEHVAQAIQIWGLGWPRPQAKGLLGLAYPWLVTSEWMHYGYALLMLVGLVVLRGGFTGPARTWWSLALGIQIWHHFEHLLLLVQVLTHRLFFGASVPTSVLQVFFPRVELHLFYNTVVTVPMIVAVVLHQRRHRGAASLRPRRALTWRTR
jgi:hypothetical protein